MTLKETALIIGAIDDLLIENLDCYEQFTEEERQVIAELYEEIFDTTSPRDVRESMITLARKLYEELKGGILN